MKKVNTMSSKVKKLKSMSGDPLYIGSEVLPTPLLGLWKMQKIQKLNFILIIVKTYSNEP